VADPTAPVIDSEALRLLLLNDTPQHVIATKFGVDRRTVRRQIQRERAVYGPKWPLSCPAAPTAKQAAKAAVVEAVSHLEPPAEDATPDELEAYALRVWVAESQVGRGADRIAAAGKIVELARERRSRHDPAADAPDPVEAAAEVLRAIELATENVEDVPISS
jgi:hypothetical protein